jgi:hypothetical protein
LLKDPRVRGGKLIKKKTRTKVKGSKKAKVIKKTGPTYKFSYSEADLWSFLLDSLPKKYYLKSGEDQLWFKMTSALKSENLENLWDRFGFPAVNGYFVLIVMLDSLLELPIVHSLTSTQSNRLTKDTSYFLYFLHTQFIN